VSNSLTINKLKSKSRVKSSNKPYSNLTENENRVDDFILNNFNDNDDKEVKSVDIKINSNYNNNLNWSGNKFKNHSNKTNKNEDSTNIKKKLPRDSKSPNIRNYRTKRNMNSNSLNEHIPVFTAVQNNSENTPSNLTKIQIIKNSTSKKLLIYYL